MSSFEPSYICQIASDIVEMIKDSDEQYFPKVIFGLIKLNVSIEIFLNNKAFIIS